MSYQKKYLKYKLKYLNLKKEISTHIGGIQITREEFKGYLDKPNTTLDLSKAPMEDEEVVNLFKAIKENTTVKDLGLNLSYKRIGYNGVQEIKQAFDEKNEIFTSLDLSNATIERKKISLEGYRDEYNHFQDGAFDLFNNDKLDENYYYIYLTSDYIYTSLIRSI